MTSYGIDDGADELDVYLHQANAVALAALVHRLPVLDRFQQLLQRIASQTEEMGVSRDRDSDR